MCDQPTTVCQYNYLSCTCKFTATADNNDRVTLYVYTASTSEQKHRGQPLMTMEAYWLGISVWSVTDTTTSFICI